MNNENKRFKQINRIATPIQVSKESQTLNEPIKEIEKKESETIKGKKQTKKLEKKQISKVQIIETLIGLFIIGIIISSAFLLISIKNKSNNLKYNDATTIKVGSAGIFSFGSETLNDSLYLNENENYQVEDFTLKKVDNTLYINNIAVATKEKFSSSVGFVDDILLFTGSDNELRTTVFFAFSSKGEKILEIYDIGDVNGMFLNDEEPAIYNSSEVVLLTSNVLKDQLFVNNNPITICDEEKLFENSIETSRLVNVNYALVYEGKHKFKLEKTNELTLKEYIKNNNYCN
ncbi:MAG: hypothetical protein OSJ65_04480 [Bacilli bacterium]|nr:hypothetical protein [Bacilli bacterium]